MNCYLLPDSKAQSNPRETETPESHRSSEKTSLLHTQPTRSPPENLPLRPPLCTRDVADTAALRDIPARDSSRRVIV